MSFVRTLPAALAAIVVAASVAVQAPYACAAETAKAPNEDSIVKSAEKHLNCVTGEKRTVVDSAGHKHVLKCVNIQKRRLHPSILLSSRVPAPANHWDPYESNSFRCGTSFVRNEQILYLRYVGTVYASGDYGSGEDCGGSGRVVGRRLHTSVAGAFYLPRMLVLDKEKLLPRGTPWTLQPLIRKFITTLLWSS